MPKTNHERGFVDERDYRTPPGDFCRGKHGAAKDKRGEKKFRRSRLRFHQNQETMKLVYDEDATLTPTPFDRGKTEAYSKLRKCSGDGSGPMKCTRCGKEPNMLRVYSLEVRLCKGCDGQVNAFIKHTGPLRDGPSGHIEIPGE